jgi:hypothetical protein
MVNARKDEQIKLRGNRIDPAEIGSVLREPVDVRDAALVVRKNETGLPQSLAAYVELRPSTGGLHSPDLHSMLENRLPAYMLPATFHIVEALPRLPNLKVDRVRLRELDAASRSERRRIASSPGLSPAGPVPNGGSIAQNPQAGPLHHQIMDIWRCLIGRIRLRLSPKPSVNLSGRDNVRAIGSIPVFPHHAASLPRRCLSR